MAVALAVDSCIEADVDDQCKSAEATTAEAVVALSSCDGEGYCGYEEAGGGAAAADS